KNSTLMNIIFYLALLFIILKSLSSLFIDIEIMSNFKIAIHILLVALYVLVGYLYYKRYMKREK
ncbi:hypothetical protein LJC13_01480, partial [Peptostreptococcaceae bacterium OttesenSCG-928-C18]|nr:hypothetical protein [Peptostreptococcaceae bacterium OttesenSCG-928-C18]